MNQKSSLQMAPAMSEISDNSQGNVLCQIQNVKNDINIESAVIYQDTKYDTAKDNDNTVTDQYDIDSAVTSQNTSSVTPDMTELRCDDIDLRCHEADLTCHEVIEGQLCGDTLDDDQKDQNNQLESSHAPPVRSIKDLTILNDDRVLQNLLR